MYGKHDIVARHLGVSFFSVILLPLALSCDSNRTMRDIAEHYANIISPLIQHRENNITGTLKAENISCKEKEIPKCEKDKEREFILNVTCSHRRSIRFFKLDDLEHEILCSLDCSCPTKQSCPEVQSTRRHHRHGRNRNSGGERGKEKKTEETAGSTEGPPERKDTEGKEVDSRRRQRREKMNGSRNPPDTKKTSRRWCGLKAFLDSLKLCYMSLGERYGGQTHPGSVG
ncbi:uncharacterized protein LOC105008967 [Esox lucius]|uniref:Platelet-derived growth factor (PDGF) family profile domain-containing protein n=1 Tax=Esox lucius TaxID=8010 RepID=A0A3P8XVX7_ESOLU|nr:uncharacterized protein LOC105008967 [Esox lucius]